MKLTTLFHPQPLTTGQSFALLFLRIIAGLAFIHHGWGKIQHPFEWMGPDSSMPGILQALAALAEFGGGFAWIIGLLTPLASFGLFCTMIVAVRLHMIVLNHPFVAQNPGEMSYELAAIYLCIALLLLILGPGKFSFDQLFFKKNKTMIVQVIKENDPS